MMVGGTRLRHPVTELFRPESATYPYRSARYITRQLFFKINLQRAEEEAPAATVYRSCYRRFRYRIRGSSRI